VRRAQKQKQKGEGNPDSFPGEENRFVPREGGEENFYNLYY